MMADTDHLPVSASGHVLNLRDNDAMPRNYGIEKENRRRPAAMKSCLMVGDLALNSHTMLQIR